MLGVIGPIRLITYHFGFLKPELFGRWLQAEGTTVWNEGNVSVVFPAYNEAENIAQAVRSFAEQVYVDEVIVVDNNSADNTGELARAAGARVILETKQGYGFALQRGLQEATGNYIILAEPDGTFEANDVLKLLAYSRDFDCVLGTRTSKELIWQGANMGFFLRWGNWSVAKLLEFLFNGPCLSDCGCTLRLINKGGLGKITDQFTVGGSHFLPEMVILLLRSGCRLIEIPVNYGPRVGTSKITGQWSGMVRVGLRMIGLILRYRLQTIGPGKRKNTR